MLSRRAFIAITTSFVVAPRALSAALEIPSLLDHILLGCGDLEQGVAFLEQRTGIKAAFGGVHPGRGTKNALLSLGEQRYLEVIAPDPAQVSIEPFAQKQATQLKSLAAPRLIGWAVHPGKLEGLAHKLQDAGISAMGPTAGSRRRSDGRLLKWQTLNLSDNRNGILPFFIEWSSDTVHPSVDSPKGCRLERFMIATPDVPEMSAVFRKLGVEVAIEAGTMAQLRARITSPRGTFDLTS